MCTTRPTWTVGAAIVALLGPVTNGVAADRFWNTATGGLFSDPLNWDGGDLGVPGADDVAIFELPASYDVELGSSAIVDRLVVGDGIVSVRLTGAGVELDALNSFTLTPGLAVGDATGDNGELRIIGRAGGALHAVYADLAAAPGSLGSLVLADPLASVAIDEEFRIGNRGVGFLELLGGASIACPITALGRASGAYGEAIVGGVGSTLACSTRLSVGSAGSGVLRIEDGASVTSGAGIIAQLAGSSGEVTVVDAAWLIDGSLDVGMSGSANLRIENGGVVECSAFGTIGAFGGAFDPGLGSHGDVVVDGPGSRWSVAGDGPGSAGLFVSIAGTASLISARGGRIEVEGDLVINSGGSLGFVLDGDSMGSPLVHVGGRLRGDLEQPTASVSFDDGHVPSPGDRFTLLSGLVGLDRVDVQLDDGGPPVVVRQTTNVLEVLVLDEACLVVADDCNGNGIDDTCELEFGFSIDCNANGIPDACDIAAGKADDCNANGIPDDCELADRTVEDCNANGIPDGCEVRTEVELDSGVQSPVSFATPIDLVLGDAPEQTEDVFVTVSIVSDLDSPFERLEFEVNGLEVGVLFADDGENCPAEPQTDTLVIPAPEFNFASGLAPQTVVTIRPRSLAEQDCEGMSWMQAIVTYQAFGGPLDTNGNGVPDDCECTGDIDGSGDVGFTDLLQVLADWGPCSPGVPCPSDLDNDDEVGFTDLLTVLAHWGNCDV